MSLDDDIKRSLRGRAEDVVPARGAWSGIEKKVRRAHAQRLAAFSTLAVAMIAAGVVLGLPHLRGTASPKPGSFASQPGASAQPSYNCDPPNACATASASPSPAAAAPAQIFRNETDGYQLELPDGWRSMMFEGTAELIPPGQSSLEKGTDTFVVSASLVDQSQVPNSRGPGTSSKDGISVQEPLSNGGQKESDYFTFLDAAPDCRPGNPCPAVQRYLRVVAMGSTDALWGAYGADGVRIARNAIDAYQVFPAAGTDVVTARGSVDKAVRYDVLTQALARFLDARIDGGGADKWLPAGVVSYDPPAHQLTLYGYSGYSVTQRQDNDNSTAEFTVEMQRIDASGSPMAPIVEHITIGPYAGGASTKPPYVVTSAK